jgi:xanthine dehydrogenase YagS FAD-binding subunit
MHAILGTSDLCFAAHASDAAVALVALDAVVEIEGSSGSRRVPLTEFYLLPAATPHIENALSDGELITAVEIPLHAARRGSIYLKVRDRASYEFALVSVAAGLDVSGGRVTAARVALGGVGTIPWRAREAESYLIGKPPTDENFADAARAALAGAQPRRDNAFKVALAQNAIERALRDAAGKR